MTPIPIVRGRWRCSLEIRWKMGPEPPADLCDGDLVVRLTHPGEPTYPLPRDHTVEMLLCPVLCHHVAFNACGCSARHRRTQPSRLAPPATPRRTITDR